MVSPAPAPALWQPRAMREALDDIGDPS